MKTVIHKADTRGHFDHGWLKTWHTFSFAEYHDRERMHFGMLRVINDDIVEAGMGFGTHPHDNMEIVTIPLRGSLEHRDSMGHTEVIEPNEVQVMSAGTGIYHSEYNASQKDPVSLLQIWVFPAERNVTPRYDQKVFKPSDRRNKLHTLVSPKGEDGGLWLNQNVFFSRCDMDKGKTLEYEIKIKDNGVYIFLIEGKIQIEDTALETRDGIGIWDCNNVKINILEDSQLLFIDVPME